MKGYIQYKLCKNIKKPEQFLRTWDKCNIWESTILENPVQEPKKSLDTYEQLINTIIWT